MASKKPQFPAEKIAEWREVFTLFDQNGDGDISVTELATVMKQLGKNPTDAQLKAIIKEVDVDASGSIDFDEFCIMMQKEEASSAEQLPDDELRAAFELCDTDKNGSVTATELLNAMNNVLGMSMTLGEVRAMIKEADQDGNGEIDFPEFKKIMAALGSK